MPQCRDPQHPLDRSDSLHSSCDAKPKFPAQRPKGRGSLLKRTENVLDDMSAKNHSIAMLFNPNSSATGIPHKAIPQTLAGCVGVHSDGVTIPLKQTLQQPSDCAYSSYQRPTFLTQALSQYLTCQVHAWFSNHMRGPL